MRKAARDSAEPAKGIVKLTPAPHTEHLSDRQLSYHGYRFPSEIISGAVWLYHRFCLGFRDVEDLLAERGVTVSYEAIRQWCLRFGPEYARRLKRHRGRLGDTWYLDEVFITIRGERDDLWRAVNQDGVAIDILVQRRRERHMRRFKSPGQARRFLTIHGAVQNSFRVGRHLMSAAHSRLFRTRAFVEWQQLRCAL